MVYKGEYIIECVATFLLFSSLIWLNECYKDSEDIASDRGYKRTFPTELGWNESWLRLVSALHVVAFVFFWHTNVYLQWVALIFVPFLARYQVLARDSYSRVKLPQNAIRNLIKIAGLVLYVT